MPKRLHPTQGGHTVDGKTATNPQPPASEEGEKPAPEVTNRQIGLLDEMVGGPYSTCVHCEAGTSELNISIAHFQLSSGCFFQTSTYLP